MAYCSMIVKIHVDLFYEPVNLQFLRGTILSGRDQNFVMDPFNSVVFRFDFVLFFRIGELRKPDYDYAFV